MDESTHYTSVWSDLQEVEFCQGFIDAGGYRTRYLRAGDSSKPKLILLHGVTGHAEAYVRQLSQFSKDYDVWAIDFIGHGYSAKPPHPLEIPHYVDHVQRFLDAIGADKAHFSGESLGGWVTARLAQEHPDRVDHILLNTMGGTRADPKVMNALYRLSTEAAEDPSWERVKARLEWLMADPSHVTPDLIRTRQAIFEQRDWKMACEMNMALQNVNTRKRNMISDDDLRSIQAPALVVWTTKDPSGPVEEGRRIASLIPNAKLAVISNAGHWPQYEQPEVFNAIQAHFLADRLGQTGDYLGASIEEHPVHATP